MITLTSKGSFKKTRSFLKKLNEFDYMRILSKYGVEGVLALREATPKDTGETADSWGFRITEKNGNYTLSWTNSHIENGVPIAVILQYGHGTGTGGYVQGRDYINPAIRPIFDRIAEEAWKEVTR